MTFGTSLYQLHNIQYDTIITAKVKCVIKNIVCIQKYKYILNLYSATTWSDTSAKKKSIFKGRTPGWKTQLNSTSCNGRRCEHLFVRISMTLLYIYVSVITFTDLSPVPVMSAVKSYFTSLSTHNLSKRALNRLTEKFSFLKFTLKTEVSLIRWRRDDKLFQATGTVTQQTRSPDFVLVRGLT